MQISRRSLLKATVAGGLVTVATHPLIGSAARSAPAEILFRAPAAPAGPRPLPFLLPESDLPVMRLDVEASRAKQQFVLDGGKSIGDFGTGCVVLVPAGAELALRHQNWKVKNGVKTINGLRLIIRGETGGKRPLLKTTGNHDLFEAYSANGGWGLKIGLEFENVDIKAGKDGRAAIRGHFLRFLRLSNVKIEGGRNCVFVPAGPTTIVMEDSELFHGGTGDRLTHCYYGFGEAFFARRCRFHSAKAPGHALKCYAQTINVQDCEILSWDTFRDKERKFFGSYPPLDIGAWGNTLFYRNTIVRRGPARDSCLEFRNRRPGSGGRWIPKGFNAKFKEYPLMDNRNELEPRLFRHLVVENRFINGILPDGSKDPHIVRKPGVAIRHNGTAPWACDSGKCKKSRPPAEWQPHHDRAVVWSVNNRFEGVPFKKRYNNVPWNHGQYKTAVREVDVLPSWASI